MSLSKRCNQIFVVGTGRCGTTTFARACENARNRTVGHETCAGKVYSFEYPQKHIEVDAPLVFRMNDLRRLNPGCRFVHLIRTDRAACIESMVRYDPEICRAFGWMVYHFAECDALTGAAALYDTITRIPKGNDVLTVSLESIKENWSKCWEWMGCEGDFIKSLETWEHKFNASTT